MQGGNRSFLFSFVRWHPHGPGVLVQSVLVLPVLPVSVQQKLPVRPVGKCVSADSSGSDLTKTSGFEETSASAGSSVSARLTAERLSSCSSSEPVYSL